MSGRSKGLKLVSCGRQGGKSGEGRLTRLEIKLFVPEVALRESWGGGKENELLGRMTDNEKQCGGFDGGRTTDTVEGLRCRRMTQ